MMMMMTMTKIIEEDEGSDDFGDAEDMMSRDENPCEDAGQHDGSVGAMAG